MLLLMQFELMTRFSAKRIQCHEIDRKSDSD
jgi:hypothetical protein